jgi:hypothetical protein
MVLSVETCSDHAESLHTMRCNDHWQVVFASKPTQLLAAAC